MVFPHGRERLPYHWNFQVSTDALKWTHLLCTVKAVFTYLIMVMSQHRKTTKVKLDSDNFLYIKEAASQPGSLIMQHLVWYGDTWH